MINTFAEQLKEYIENAPDEILIKYSDNIDFVSFMGILFKDNNQVFAYNILTYNPHDDTDHQYLNITQVFNKGIQQLNIFHLCILVRDALRKYYRENDVAENLLPLIKHDDYTLLPRLRYEIKKNNGREWKYIKGYKNASVVGWNKILYSAITEDSRYSTYKKYRRKRLSFSDFTSEERGGLSILQNVEI